MSLPQHELQRMVRELSLAASEEAHIETLEEANDFGIEDDEEDQDFFHNLTVYEMHEAAEDNLALLEQAQLNQEPAESNETGDQGEESPTPHAQSAPVELNTPASNQPSSLSDNDNK